MKTSKRERWAMAFYWVGALMTFSAIALVVFSNTKLVYQVQHTSFPLAWKFAAVAVVAFLVGEICRPAPQELQKRDSRHSLDHIPYEI